VPAPHSLDNGGVEPGAAAPIRLPPVPALRVAFVLLHAQAGDDFFSDVPFSWIAGQLREIGVGAELLHVHYPRGADPEPCTSQLLDWLAAGNFGLTVVDQLWDLSLLPRIRQATGGWIAGTDAFADYGGERVEFRLRHFADHRRPLRELVLALRDGNDLRTVPNLAMDLPGFALLHTHEEARPATPEALEPFCPVADATVIGQPRNADGSLPRVRKSLEASTGCPFAAPVAHNPSFAGLVFPDDVTVKGCSFCFMGGDYRALNAADSVRVQLDQIAYWQTHLPRLDEVVLRDQSALRYLPALIQGAVERDLRPVGFLVPGRGDAILRFARELQAAADVAQQSQRFWFTLHLIGFESFSQPQLDLYNKGVTVAEYAQAVADLRALGRRFPQGFRLDRAGASSFILFNPWTTLADLHATVDFCAAHALHELAKGLTLTRMRLYPNLPLYWKAKRDGLLVEAATGGHAFGAAFTGYSAEALWRYQDERVAAVEAMQQRLCSEVAPEAAVGLLRAVLRWVGRAHFDSLDQAIAPIARKFGEFRDCIQGSAHGAPSENQAPRPRNAMRTVRAGSACNNQCQTCIAHRGSFDDDVDVLADRVRRAVSSARRVTLSGREPTLLAGLPQLVRAANGASVELVTNARVLAAGRGAAQLRKAGLTRALVKRHRLADADEDSFCGADGAGPQNTSGVDQLQQAGVPWALLAIPAAGAAHELPLLVDWAAARGCVGVQVQVLAGELDLDDLSGWIAALQEARTAAARHGLDLHAEGPA
jgi:hypothetical protein